MPQDGWAWRTRRGVAAITPPAAPSRTLAGMAGAVVRLPSGRRRAPGTRFRFAGTGQKNRAPGINDTSAQACSAPPRGRASAFTVASARAGAFTPMIPAVPTLFCPPGRRRSPLA